MRNGVEAEGRVAVYMFRLDREGQGGSVQLRSEKARPNKGQD